MKALYRLALIATVAAVGEATAANAELPAVDSALTIATARVVKITAEGDL